MQLRRYCVLFLFYLLTNQSFSQKAQNNFSWQYGGIVRGDSTIKQLSLVFTADEFGEGLPLILKTLHKQNIKAAFFFTGRFFRNKKFKAAITQLQARGHYIGPHSNEHLLYCDWAKRDSLLVTKDSFEKDMEANLAAMRASGLAVMNPHYFIPPYEWWNDSVSHWSNKKNLHVVNFTPGVRTNADYTWPELGAVYKSNEWIINWLKETLVQHPNKLNGAVMLIHAGTDPRRKEKLYFRLEEIIALLKEAGYQFHRIDSLLKN